MSINSPEYNRQYRQAHRERLRENNRAYRQANLERLRARDRAYTQANHERAAERHREWFAQLRVAVFQHYERSCACCGSTDRLTIDHVNGDGQEHRQELFGHRPPVRWPDGQHGDVLPLAGQQRLR